MPDLISIAPKLKPLVRMLSSSSRRRGAQCSACDHAQYSRAPGSTVHTLADNLGNGGGLTEAEMRKLYDAGFEAGMRAVEHKQHPGDFHNTDGTPAWHEMARWCQRQSDRLGNNERDFVSDMAGRTVWREPTDEAGQVAQVDLLQAGRGDIDGAHHS